MTKRDYTTKLINQVILETGYSRATVKGVVESFLAVLQEKSCEEIIYIKGFGELEAKVVGRFFYDINNKIKYAYSEKPKVIFKPSVAYENMVDRTHKENNKEETVVREKSKQG
jgi:nucleoid DNA-binding protein